MYRNVLWHNKLSVLNVAFIRMTNTFVILFFLLSLDVQTITALETFIYTAVSAEYKAHCSQDEGNLVLNDACYVSVTSPTDYKTAAADCISKHGMYLLSVTTPEELVHLRKEKYFDESLWLGLEDASSSSYLKWSDGSYSKWYRDQIPIDWTNEQESNCPLISAQGDTINFVPCYEEHPYVCKSRFFEACYPSWTYDPAKDTCYRMFGTNFDNFDQNLPIPQLNARDAASACQSYMGGHLMPTFAGSFALSWDPKWKFVGDYWKAWVGFFYSAVSSTGFARDDGTELVLDEKLFFVSRDTPSLYECSYYLKTNDTTRAKVRIYPEQECALDLFYFCQMPSMDTLKTQVATVPPDTETTKPPPAVSNVCKSSASRRVMWFKVVPHSRLAGHVIGARLASSRVDCAIQCSNHPDCKSFNYDFTTTTPWCEYNDVAEKIERLDASAGTVDYAYMNCD